MCVVAIEYSADNLRYKLRFVNGQMVHVRFTNFCLYESFGPESLFRISTCKRDYGNRMDFQILRTRNEFRFKNCNYFTIVLQRNLIYFLYRGKICILIFRLHTTDDATLAPRDY